MTLTGPRTVRHPSPAPARGSVFAPGWPLAALFVLYPLWWALGLRTIIFPVLAVPMALTLLKRRPIKVPPGFGLWLLFLVWFVASMSMLRQNPPGTIDDGFHASELMAVAVRLVEYLTITVALLYLGNLSEKELPRLRVVRMLGALFLTTVIGGLFALALPTFEFTSPVEMILPSALANEPYVQSLVHPSTAQVMDFLGYTEGRPAAPYGYTNEWGQNLNLLLVWFAVGWFMRGTHLRRTISLVACCLALAPAIYSLNRGLWIGLALSAIYLAVRLAARGRLWGLGALGTLTAALAIAFVVSPLQEVVTARLAHPHSNSIRGFTVERTIEATSHSPVLGYGNTRDNRGSAHSIAIGPTPACPNCGTATLGSNGQLWLVLISQGYVGAAIYLSFFVVALLRYGRDPTPIGWAGTLVLLLSFMYMFVYNALVMPLMIYMLSFGLLWRNDTDRRAAE
ncbi:MAG: O-antigen ligase family protein [Streptosporangiaceae bacterium]